MTDFSTIAKKREHPKDFEILWICADCGQVSLFHNDLEEHKQKMNHHNVAKIDLDNDKLIAQYRQQSI
jgi:protein-arginine kinase activator protein McsA